VMPMSPSPPSTRTASEPRSPVDACGQHAAAASTGEVGTIVPGRRQGAADDPVWIPPRPREADRGRARTEPMMTEATVIAMPMCEVVRMAGPAPTARDEVDDSGGRGGMNDAMGGWPVSSRKFLMIGILVSLGLVAVGATVAVVILKLANPVDPVTTSTSSTAAIPTSTASTTTTDMITVSKKYRPA
jgi:hypothetical protein